MRIPGLRKEENFFTVRSEREKEKGKDEKGEKTVFLLAVAISRMFLKLELNMVQETGIIRGLRLTQYDR